MELNYKSTGRINKSQIIPKGQSKKDNAEKLEAYGTQDEDKQNKNTTRYVLDTNIRKQTQIRQETFLFIYIAYLDQVI